ncbi:MAG TPA: TonB-dependent receptor [Segetibacter sp.]|jgi:hypothetical protein
MKKILTLLSAILISNCLFAQVKISGTVKDGKGKAIAGVSITIKDTYDGATTDSTGRFAFRTAEKGTRTFQFTSIGFNEIEKVVSLDKEAIELSIEMKEKLDELKAVMVTAGTFEAGDKKRAATVLSNLDVLTTGGANADIVAAVKTLPGAQQVGETEGLFVRGGTGQETKQFIDGTMVNNPFQSSVPDIAQRGRFAPSLFKGTVFSTGGYSALYGQALSSALILETIDMPEKSEANAGISPLFISAGYQQLAKNKKSSWGTNYSYTNLLAYFKIVKQTPDYFKVPEFHGADANFRFKTKNGGMVKYYTTFGISTLGLRRPDIDSAGIKNAFALDNTNWYNNLSWKESLRNGWKMNIGMSYSTNVDKINNQLQDQQNQSKTFPGQDWMNNKNFDLNSTQDLSQIRAVFEKRLKGISSIRFGSKYMYAHNKSTYNGYKALLNDHYNAAFAETDIYLTNNIAAKIGGRVEYSSIIDKANVAPRLSLAYKTGKDAQVSVAYGTFYQKPENIQLIQTTDLGYTKATHYIANYQKTNKFYTFRLEGFYKKYEDLIKTSPTINNDGEGYAKGIELFFRDKKTIKNLDYWISYSYLDTKRDYLNYPGKLQPNFAANHTASLVTKRWVTKLSTGFNFTYSYASGRPYYNFKYNNSTSKYSIADQGTTKDYHNLGFSANYVKKVGNAYAVLVGSVTNVLGANQVFGYNYSHDGYRKQVITTPAKRFYFIGVFVSWGVDRTQDAINGNL